MIPCNGSNNNVTELKYDWGPGAGGCTIILLLQDNTTNEMQKTGQFDEFKYGCY